MFCYFVIYLTVVFHFFLVIGPFLTGAQILLAVMNWELNDSCIASYGINLDQPTSSLTFSRVLFSPFWILFVAPLTLKSKWFRILNKKAWHLVMEARKKIWSQRMTRHSYLYQEEYAQSRRRKWRISILSKSRGWFALATKQGWEVEIRSIKIFWIDLFVAQFAKFPM